MKVARLLTFTGFALLLAAVVLFLWKAAPIISSRLYTSSIPAAPSLSPLRTGSVPGGVPGTDALTLLPFEGTGTAPQRTSSILTSPTPEPTLTPKATGETVTVILTTSTPFASRPATATPTPVVGAVPAYLNVPVLDLKAPIVPIGIKTVTVNGTTAQMWDVPGYRAAGWHETSARLGLPGNTVLNGHNTLSGEVFRDLYKIPVGALVLVVSEEGAEFAYRVKEKYILPEAGQSLEVRLQNARYVQQTEDERLTLVTCHPYGSLTYRLIVIAVPAPASSQRGE
jgi:LPXTG-site transpeptidase (sortase) family protein